MTLAALVVLCLLAGRPGLDEDVFHAGGFEAAEQRAARAAGWLLGVVVPAGSGPVPGGIDDRLTAWWLGGVSDWIKRRAIAVRVDAGSRPDLLARFGVSKLPSVLALRDGGVVARLSGW